MFMLACAFYACTVVCEKHVKAAVSLCLWQASRTKAILENSELQFRLGEALEEKAAASQQMEALRGHIEQLQKDCFIYLEEKKTYSTKVSSWPESLCHHPSTSLDYSTVVMLSQNPSNRMLPLGLPGFPLSIAMDKKQ